MRGSLVRIRLGAQLKGLAFVLIPFFIFNFILFAIMKFLFLLLSVLVTSFSFSQDLYFEGGVSYNKGVNRMTAGVYNSTSTNNNGVTKRTSEQVYYSLGEGVSFSGTLGISISDNIGFELALSRLIGNKFSMKNYSSYEFSQSTTIYSYEYVFQSKFTQVTPSIVFSLGDGAIMPFSKLGLIYNIGSLNVDIEEIDDEDVVIREIDFTGGVTFGFSTVFGVEYTLSEKLKLVGALDFKLLSYSPKKSEVVKNELNGESILEDMSVANRETLFFDKVEFDSSVSNSDEPSKQLKEMMSGSSLGFKVGLKFLL